MTIHSVTVDVGGRPLTLETGKLAKQSNGSVVVRQAESAVLVTAVADTKEVDFDFVPLTVDYLDRTGAYGGIPGGYLKREGGRSERETLVSRLIDRPVRPQFHKHWRNETQVIATVLSFDAGCDADVLAVCGASAALAVSDIPQKGHVGAVRIVEVDGKFIINPDRALIPQSTIHLIVAGNDEAIAMVEGGSREASEDRLIEAMNLAHQEIRKIVGAIAELQKKAGVAKRDIGPAPEPAPEFLKKVKELGLDSLVAAMATKGKHERKDAIKAARKAVLATLTAGKTDETELAQIESDLGEAWEKMIRGEMRKQVIEKGRRIDGRATDEIRAIHCEVSVAPRAHGSSLFTRGETQAFTTAALGVDDDVQYIEQPGAKEEIRRWMLTYNFPPFSTGEVKRLAAPKRREVGHGALAHRAFFAVLPEQATFPYVLRCCADVLESNGSSSMATVCGSTLALLDAGVPLKAPVAGIAMGLIKEGDKFAVLSDILGDEDALGDMDFKVTGTKNGVTAFQMDVKIGAVPSEIMRKALMQAREGRIHILGEMAKAIDAPRGELSPYAPRITTIKINPEKIRELIGPGGKVIRGIQEKTGVKVSVEDSGQVQIASSDMAATDRALALIREITQEAEIGKLYLGVVKRITDFGAFVEIFPGTDGLIHISHLAHERVNRVTDVVQEGDEVLVRVIDIDKAGKIRLSRKEALDAGASA